MSNQHTKECRKNWQAVAGGYYCPVHDDFIDQEAEFADGMKKIFANKGKTCDDCHHFNGHFSCPAFPDVIPDPFWLGEEVHTRPKYGQTNKIVFEPKEKKNGKRSTKS